MKVGGDKMLIVSDLHGVIIDTLSILELRSDLALEFYNKNIEPKNFFRHNVISQGLLSFDEYQKICDKIYGEWRYTQQMREVDGAGLVIQKLSADKSVEFIILTTVTGKMLNCAKKWLKEYQIDYKSIIGVGVDGDRQSLLKNFKPDIYIDDNPDNLFSLVGKNIKLLLFDWWYNQDIDVPQVKRVSNWQDILKTAGV